MRTRVMSSTDTPLDTWVTFNDLRKAGIVPNWPTLHAWVKNPEIKFPPGRLFGKCSRRWSQQREIEPWLASRPVTRGEFNDPPPMPKRHYKRREVVVDPLL